MNLQSTPSERLALSRGRLRQCLLDISASQLAAQSRCTEHSSPAWLGSLKSIPGSSRVIQAVCNWWMQHPLRLIGLFATDAVATAARPMAQRHPLALMLGSMALGGLLIWSRPWRWMLRPARLANLLPQIFYQTVTAAPVQSWVALLTSLAQDWRQSDRPHSAAR